MADATLTLIYTFAADRTLAARRGPTLSPIRDSLGTFYDAAGVLQTAAVDVPRFDHNPATRESLGLLVENIRRNVGLNSEDASVNDGESGTTVSTNTDVAPNGATTMDSIFEAATNSAHELKLASVAVFSSQQYVFTYFVKKLNNQFVEMDWFEDGAGGQAPRIIFDLDAGSVSSSSGIDRSFVQDIGGGIFRIGFAATMAADTDNIAPRVWLNTNGASQQSYLGNTSNGVIVWGKQIEAGNTPSSYIASGATAEFRQPDNFLTQDLTWLTSIRGTFYVRSSAIFWGRAGEVNSTFELTSGATQQHFVFMDDVVALRILNAQGEDWIQDTSVTLAGKDGQEIGVAYAFDKDDGALFVDGAAEGTPVKLDPPTGLISLRMGQEGGDRMDGHIAEFRYYNVRKSDAFVQELSRGDISELFGNMPLLGVQ